MSEVIQFKPKDKPVVTLEWIDIQLERIQMASQVFYPVEQITELLLLAREAIRGEK